MRTEHLIVTPEGLLKTIVTIKPEYVDTFKSDPNYDIATFDGKEGVEYAEMNGLIRSDHMDELIHKNNESAFGYYELIDDIVFIRVRPDQFPEFKRDLV